ncbi:phosphoglycolate phosphatase [Lentzea xinjiangensis]|uniref:Tyrosine-protein kinase PtkA n=1 Tax=Lentzea xinjiangensis TaxID=402600 RepID=A0A1H9RR87_9PSEU|nr:HAD family hydrolase [Lentzea xinjiangensis]SER75330.1 phosphoglycolate phosphatase [Lentzea xinjiangensis]
MNRCVIFDLDGTLVDSPRGIVTTFAAVFAQLDLPTADSGSIRGTIGLPLPAAFAKVLGTAEDEPVVAACVELYQPTFRKIVLPTAPQLVFPGVFDGLQSLREDGFLLAVATSKFIANAEALLVAAGLREDFSVVVGADQVARPKPDPESGFVVLDRLGVAPGNAVMVGDTTHDVLMAHGAGMASIGVTYGVHTVDQLLSANPTWLVDSFAGVVAAVKECS